MLIRPVVLASVICIGFASFTIADIVTLEPVPGYSTGAHVNALAGPLFASTLDSFDIPGTGDGTVSATELDNTATHEYAVKLDFSTTPAFFDSIYSGPFVRTGTLDHRASAESIFHFSVDTPTVYDVMGVFAITDDVGTTIPGNVELEIELLEFDAFGSGSHPSTVFYSYQVSKSTIDQAFMVGAMDGDFANALVGMPTGLLDPSKVYRYRTLVTINAIDIDGSDPMLPTDGGAMAEGEHIIRFSKFTGVPEPTTGLFCMLATCFLIGARRRV